MRIFSSVVTHTMSKISHFLKQHHKELIRTAEKTSSPQSIVTPPTNRTLIFNSDQFKLAPLKHLNPEKFYDTYKPPSYIDESLLPSKRTDIRGIDASAYRYLQKKSIINPAPIVVNNPYVQIRYFPESHLLSKLRKSNIAIGNFNTPLNPLNDPVLAQSLKAYKGKYRSHLYFIENRNPLTTAVNRAKVKKLIKEMFVDAMKQVKSNQVDLVRGFYFVRYLKYPNTHKDKEKLQQSVYGGIGNLLNIDLPDLTRKMKLLNKLINEKDLLRKANKYNVVGERNIPLYYPKLPFLSQKRRKRT